MHDVHIVAMGFCQVAELSAPMFCPKCSVIWIVDAHAAESKEVTPMIAQTLVRDISNMGRTKTILKSEAGAEGVGEVS